VRPPRAVVFDLDGTLADTRLDIAAACNHALTSLGRPARSVDEISLLVGDGARALVSRAFGHPPDDPRTDEAVGMFNEYYRRHPAAHVRWMPGAREALLACGAVPVALATNKPRAVTVPLLEALGLGARFRAVVAGGDGPLKPDPSSIHAALAPLGVAAEDAWVVGDGPQDVGAGRAAGAWTVGVLGGFLSERALRDARPDRVLQSLHDFAKLLAEVTEAARARSGERSPPSGAPSSR